MKNQKILIGIGVVVVVLIVVYFAYTRYLKNQIFEKISKSAEKINKPIDAEVIKKKISSLNMNELRLLNKWMDLMLYGINSSESEVSKLTNKIKSTNILNTFPVQEYEGIMYGT